jgi:uncharacterized membrane protein
VAVPVERKYSNAIHPLHAIFLAGSLPLFVGAALCDVAYAKTYEIQWLNFASWLIVGALVLAAAALVFVVNDLSRAERRIPGVLLYAALLLAAWVTGFFDALAHARDAWAAMPSALVLSIIAALLACIATWFGFHTPRIGGIE